MAEQVTDPVISELVAMSQLARAVAEAKREDPIGSFAAEEDLCRAASSLRLGTALMAAAVEIERLRQSTPTKDTDQ